MGCEGIKTSLVGSRKVHVFLFIVCFSLLLLVYKWPDVRNQFQSFQLKLQQKRLLNRTVLLWSWPFGASFSLDGDVCWDLYNISGCKVVKQRSYFSSADVVVFHNRELVNGQEKLPLDDPRPQGQRWAWLTLESPSHNGNLKPFSNIFNMTITYRRDSDVYSPYGRIQPREGEAQPEDGSPPNKTFFACWVVSNFQNHHKRTQVYKELKELIPIQVYGRGVGRPLSNEDLIPTLQHCRFYLSFENLQHKDYITEKLWRNAFGSGAIPVVLGAQLDDYTAVAPPHSFIHVDQFASLKDLAEYLMQVAKDEKRYEEYFAWKKKWEVTRFLNWRDILCAICPVLDTLPAQRVYSDLEAWDRGRST